MQEVKRHGSTGPYKVKRKLNKWFIIPLCLLIIGLICMVKIPKMIEYNKLEEIGYDNTSIQAIRKLKLQDTIIDNNYYSDLFKQVLIDGNYNEKYLHFYLQETSISDDDYLLYDRLLEKGYSDVQILNLFKNLEFFEMTPLLVFDYQENEQVYIDDCINHRDSNNQNYFVLTNSYYKHYENIVEVPDTTDYKMLVNKTYHLTKEYTPKIVPAPVKYASSNVQLEQEAFEAFKVMFDALESAGLKAYIGSGYRTYEYQEELYGGYVSNMGQADADGVAARPGHSEHQTGLAIDLVSGTSVYTKFATTKEFTWLMENAQDYGFILRFPENKTQITGYNYEAWHWRYVGIELAQKIKASNLTFDEYYMLYLK